MSRWFRMYDEILDDPKVQKLGAEDFRAWVNLLALASQNEGVLPPIEDIAFRLRRSLNDAGTLVERLLNATLIDKRSGGPDGYHYAPHGWHKRQYKSDGSTERVKRFRERSKKVSETGPEPETESDTEQSPPSPPQTGGLGPGHDDPASLASDLCRRAGIAKCGPAAIAQTRRWIEAGIPPATMCSVVSSMASKAGGTTLSLKRFDQPIRREHVEHPHKPRQNGAAYEPKTEDELRRAIAAGETYGYEVGQHRAKLAELIAATADGMRVSGQAA